MGDSDWKLTPSFRRAGEPGCRTGGGFAGFCRHAGRSGTSSEPGQVDGRERMFSGSQFFLVFTGLGLAKPARPAGALTLPNLLHRVLKRFRPREIYTKLTVNREKPGRTERCLFTAQLSLSQDRFQKAGFGCCPHLGCSTSCGRHVFPSDCVSCSHVFQNQ